MDIICYVYDYNCVVLFCTGSGTLQKPAEGDGNFDLVNVTDRSIPAVKNIDRTTESLIDMAELESIKLLPVDGSTNDSSAEFQRSIFKIVFIAQLCLDGSGHRTKTDFIDETASILIAEQTVNDLNSRLGNESKYILGKGIFM